MANRCQLSADSGRELEVDAKVEINAVAKGGAQIRYNGNPNTQQIIIGTASGGSVQRVNIVQILCKIALCYAVGYVLNIVICEHMNNSYGVVATWSKGNRCYTFFAAR
ncbi:MAG: hypothetical protein RMJ87_06885 [Cytophagales bacterium]|nr:hypothetical protein [Bernardetiaceae bacterium]MDW8204738.1 hypothetical protein [Cytophagales bacterium]